MHKKNVRRSLGAATLAAAVGALGGCASFTAEDFKAVLDGVTSVAQTGAQFEAARRQGRQANTPAPTQSASYAGGQQQAQQQVATYAPLSCASLARQGGMLCMQNACGRNVVMHTRTGGSPSGSLMVAPGQCMPIVPGTSAAVACSGGDRFDWGRSACVGS
jgi:hypothetical protein